MDNTTTFIILGLILGVVAPIFYFISESIIAHNNEKMLENPYDEGMKIIKQREELAKENTLNDDELFDDLYTNPAYSNVGGNIYHNKH